METAELELAFYRNLLSRHGTRIARTDRGASTWFAHLATAPMPIHLTLQGGQTATLERIGGQDARWRVHIAPPAGEPREIDARLVEHHFDTGWSWLRALQAHAMELHIVERALERLPSPVLLIDGTGRVLFQNEAARDVLTSAAVLRIDAGRLCATTSRRPIDSHFLDSQGISSTDAKVIVALPACGETIGCTTYVEAHPLAPHLDDSRSSSHSTWLINVFVTSPLRRLSSTALRRVLGLTRAEAAVVQALFAGRRPAAIACSLNVSRETVKKQLSSIFRKCNVASQAELTRLIALGPFFCTP